MKIEKVSIDSIKVYPNNAKIHTAEQIEEIKKINSRIWKQ
jgi:hypothetical protein